MNVFSSCLSRPHTPPLQAKSHGKKIMSAALEEFKDARNFVMVCPAVEKTRSEGADVDGIHKILLASKANKLNWY